MKSSLAKTFHDVAEKKESKDRIFSSRESLRIITDEQDREIDGNHILVIDPYDEDLNVNEKTSTLLLSSELKRKYDQLLHDVNQAKQKLLDAIKSQSESKKDMETEISSAIMASPDEFDSASTSTVKV